MTIFKCSEALILLVLVGACHCGLLQFENEQSSNMEAFSGQSKRAGETDQFRVSLGRLDKSVTPFEDKAKDTVQQFLQLIENPAAGDNEEQNGEDPQCGYEVQYNCLVLNLLLT